jgi:predicted dehydrogenase
MGIGPVKWGILSTADINRLTIPEAHASEKADLVAVASRDDGRAAAYAEKWGIERSYGSYEALLEDTEIEAVYISLPNTMHVEWSIRALEAGKHVLCEKPLSFSEDEGRAMIAAATKAKRVLKCGFNHRHHPAVKQAHRLFTEGRIGKPTFGRGRYGIAGREGLAREWRSDPKVSPGGQLMEQGVHLVDLFRWFFGDMAEVTGMMSTTFWPIAPLEDNGFLLMKTGGGVVCSVHASLTQWINLFELEVYGDKGSLRVEALGASYGVEKLVFSEHDANGPFAYHTTEYRGGDVSWKDEWAEFTRAIDGGVDPIGDGVDGLRAMQVVTGAYEAAKTGRTVRLDGA